MGGLEHPVRGEPVGVLDDRGEPRRQPRGQDPEAREEVALDGVGNFVEQAEGEGRESDRRGHGEDGSRGGHACLR